LRSLVPSRDAAAPHHVSTGGGQPWQQPDRTLDVGVDDVAEQADDHQDLGGGRAGVGVGLARIAGHDLDPVACDVAQRLPRHLAVARVKLNDAPAHIAGPRVIAEHAFDVTSLSCNHADQPYRPGRDYVERLSQPPLDDGEPPGERAASILVSSMP
jgi:hypothetical protein